MGCTHSQAAQLHSGTACTANRCAQDAHAPKVTRGATILRFSSARCTTGCQRLRRRSPSALVSAMPCILFCNYSLHNTQHTTAFTHSTTPLIKNTFPATHVSPTTTTVCQQSTKPTHTCAAAQSAVGMRDAPVAQQQLTPPVYTTTTTTTTHAPSYLISKPSTNRITLHLARLPLRPNPDRPQPPIPDRHRSPALNLIVPETCRLLRSSPLVANST